MIEVSLGSGGIVKVDLKAGTDPVHRALTGQPIGATIETIRQVSNRAGERSDIPLLVVSTLLVPGYVDEVELRAIAQFLSGLDPVPPWSLLAFHPDFEMNDLPSTGIQEARTALEIANEAGLEQVHVGNLHLLL
jgi:pyruvate formate lyase activating enzyme